MTLDIIGLVHFILFYIKKITDDVLVESKQIEWIKEKHNVEKQVSILYTIRTLSRQQHVANSYSNIPVPADYLPTKNRSCTGIHLNVLILDLCHHYYMVVKEQHVFTLIWRNNRCIYYIVETSDAIYCWGGRFIALLLTLCH